VYDIRIHGLEGRESNIATGSKVFAIVVPALLNGISFTSPVLHSPAAFIAITSGQRM